MAFAREGASVVGYDIAKQLSYPTYRFGTADELQSLKEDVESLGGKCLVFAGDVRDDAAIQTAVAETIRTFGRITALENVMEGLVTVKGMSRSEAERIGTEHLIKVGLQDRLHYYPSQLSGGQQQRVAIARALALNPKAILFDEPTSALDPDLVEEVLQVMRSIAKEGMTMIVVTHEVNFAREVADRVVVLADGKIVDEGPPDEVLKNRK